MEQPSIESTIAAFIESKSVNSVHTGRTYQAGLSYFVEFLARQGVALSDPASRITKGLAIGFNSWLARQKWRKGKDGPINLLSRRTRQLYMRATLGYYKYLVLTGAASFDYGEFKSLADDLGKSTRVERSPINGKLPSDEVMEAILDQAHQEPIPDLEKSEKECRRARLIFKRTLAIILCLYSGGLRVGELVKLRYWDMDSDYHELIVIGKGEKERRVMISDEAWCALLDYLKERDGEITDRDAPLFARHDRRAKQLEPITTRSVQRAVYDLATSAGVFTKFNLTPHSFRHYFATRLLDYTGDLALTQDTLGHSDPATTRIYAKITDEKRRQALRRMFDEGGIP